MRKLVRLVITENVFIYEKKLYRQVIGREMASAFTLTLVDIFMWKWEKELIRQQEASNEIYGQYVSCIICKEYFYYLIFFPSNKSLDTINQIDIEDNPLVKTKLNQNSRGKTRNPRILNSPGLQGFSRIL
jgi:hypothetical protein